MLNDHLNSTLTVFCASQHFLNIIIPIGHIVYCYLEVKPRYLRGCGMGLWLVLVSPCFRENVFARCKIGFFLCSFDKLLQKKRNCFLFWKSDFKMALIWKTGLFLTYFSHYLVTRERLQKFLQHISHSYTYIHIFCSPFWLFWRLAHPGRPWLRHWAELKIWNWCFFFYYIIVL